MKDHLLLLDPLLVAILLQLLVPEVALQADYLLVLLLQDLDQLACNQRSFCKRLPSQSSRAGFL